MDWTEKTPEQIEADVKALLELTGGPPPISAYMRHTELPRSFEFRKDRFAIYEPSSEGEPDAD